MNKKLRKDNRSTIKYISRYVADYVLEKLDKQEIDEDTAREMTKVVSNHISNMLEVSNKHNKSFEEYYKINPEVYVENIISEIPDRILDLKKYEEELNVNVGISDCTNERVPDTFKWFGIYLFTYSIIVMILNLVGIYDNSGNYYISASLESIELIIFYLFFIGFIVVGTNLIIRYSMMVDKKYKLVILISLGIICMTIESLIMFILEEVINIDISKTFITYDGMFMIMICIVMMIFSAIFMYQKSIFNKAVIFDKGAVYLLTGIFWLLIKSILGSEIIFSKYNCSEISILKNDIIDLLPVLLVAILYVIFIFNNSRVYQSNSVFIFFIWLTAIGFEFFIRDCFYVGESMYSVKRIQDDVKQNIILLVIFVVLYIIFKNKHNKTIKNKYIG